MLQFEHGVLPVLSDEETSVLDAVAGELISQFRSSYADDGTAFRYWEDGLWYRRAVVGGSGLTGDGTETTLGGVRSSGDYWIDDDWWSEWADRLLETDAHDWRAIRVLLVLDRPRGMALLHEVADERLAHARELGHWHEELYDSALLLELGLGHEVCALAFDDEAYLREARVIRARYGLGLDDPETVAVVRDELTRRLNDARAARRTLDCASGARSAQHTAAQELDGDVDSLLEFVAGHAASFVEAGLAGDELAEVRTLALERAGAAFGTEDRFGVADICPWYEPALDCAAVMGWSDVAQVFWGNSSFVAALHAGSGIEARMSETALAWSLADPGPHAMAVAARAMIPDTRAGREALALLHGQDSLSGKRRGFDSMKQGSAGARRLGGAVAWTRCRKIAC